MNAESRSQKSEVRRDAVVSGLRIRHFVAGHLLIAFCLLLAAFCLLGATNKLYLKDGTYQLVREYKVEGDRVLRDLFADGHEAGRSAALQVAD